MSQLVYLLFVSAVTAAHDLMMTTEGHKKKLKSLATLSHDCIKTQTIIVLYNAALVYIRKKANQILF